MTGTAARSASDAGRDRPEEDIELGAEGGDRKDDHNGDQAHHEAVLNRGGATVVAQCKDLDLKFDELREHFSPLPGR